MKIVIAAGGSGGHIFPAIALANRLKAGYSGCDILFVGSRKALDQRIFHKEGFRYRLLTANKLSYRLSFGIIGFAFKLLWDFIHSFFILISYRPDVVVGFGGYVASPVVAIASLLRMPIVIHEQNVVPGRANKALFKVADRIAISFRQTVQYMGLYAEKAVVTGNPIRTEIFHNDRNKGMKQFGLNSHKFTILVIGGSQGAHRLNDTFVKVFSGLDDKTKSAIQVIHITGLKDYDDLLNLYADSGIESRVYSFLDRIEDAYSASDLVVTRSGSSALFELAFFAKPMVLVPYPYAMSHQAENARAFSSQGAAIEIDEKELSPEWVKVMMTDLLNDRQRLQRLSESAGRLAVPDSADLLATQVVEAAKRGGNVAG